jgi:hypothetical protein
MATRPPVYAPIAFDFFNITVSCSTVASARAAGVGPFAGLYFKVSSSVTIISPTGVSLVVDNVVKNTMLWISGNYLGAIATATSPYGVI